MGECYKKLNNINLAQKHIEKGKKIAEEKKDEEWIEKANRLIKELKKNIKRQQLINSL